MEKSKSSKAVILTLSVVAGVLAHGLLSNAGDLDPPGPPGSTMYSLDELYQVCAALSGPKRYVTRASGQLTMFVKFDGVDGESDDANHDKWSDAITMHQGHKLLSPEMGRLTGNIVYEDISIVKEFDKASLKLAEAVTKGKPFAKVEIELTATYGGARATYLKYELTNVLVTSYNTTGSDEGPPLEEVTVSFDEIKVTYTEYDDGGAPKGNIEYSWKDEGGGA
jgi:type VI secretion system secreted protein Hcp